MLYIFVALYVEALPFVKRLGLKRQSNCGRFVLYMDAEEQIVLAVTGPGKVEAAATVSYVCTKYGTDEASFLLNIGSAAAGNKDVHNSLIGKCYICNCLEDVDTGRTYYPDILYQHPFAETKVMTGSVVQKNREIVCGSAVKYAENAVYDNAAIYDNEAVYDMEAVGVYLAGVRFVGQHQVAFIKVVSDNFEGNCVTAEDLQHLMEERADEICTWLRSVRAVNQSWKTMTRSVPSQDLLQQLCDQTHASVTMRLQMEQLFRYCTLAGISYEKVIREDIELQRLPCRNRREGKTYIEELKERLLFE